MLENRQVTKRVFADLFRNLDIHPVDSYPNRLQELLASLSPRRDDTPTIAVLTHGIFNSAYFEHAFRARRRLIFRESRTTELEGHLDVVARSGAVAHGPVRGPFAAGGLARVPHGNLTGIRSVGLPHRQRS